MFEVLLLPLVILALVAFICWAGSGKETSGKAFGYWGGGGGYGGEGG